MTVSGEQSVTTFCRVCEPACGLVATVRDGQLVKLTPDRDHPVTRGFACPKGLAGLEIHHDPDRLNHPLRGDGLGGRSRATWDEAISDIAARTREIVDHFGGSSVAAYMGNPAGFNSLLGNSMPPLLRQLGATRHFTAGTQDCLNKYAGSNAVLGSSYLHPIPDVLNADMVLLIGSNWRASKGSFLSLPNAYGHLMAAVSRGAKVRFVNPRVTESSDARTGPTLQILPGSDVYLLAAMLCEIDRSVGFHSDATKHGKHLDELQTFVRAYPPERAAGVCGVPASAITDLALEFASADRAAVHMSTGVNQGPHGTLAYWLLHMLALVTGNLGRAGGNIVSTGYYDAASKGASVYENGFVDGEFGPMRSGDIPGGLLADYILHAKEPIKALFVVAGNPLLSLPGEAALANALRALELLVVIDVYPTATAEHAHWALPATDQFERADIAATALGMQLTPWVQFTDPVVPAQHERREEWWIFARLAQELGLRSTLDGVDPEEAKWSRVDHMLDGSGLTRQALREHPQGLALGVPPGSRDFFAESLQTRDGKVDCCPPSFTGAIERCGADFESRAAGSRDQMWLVSRRDSRMHNSWYANVPGMKRGDRDTNRLAMHPDDAAARGIADHERVVVRSEWGEVDVEVQFDPDLRSQVVSLEHGWGMQRDLRLARETAGVNVNAVMPHGPGSFDPLSNQQFMTGVPVTVTLA